MPTNRIFYAMQNAIGYVASLGEEVKNTFNFSVPFLSWLAIAILVVVALILYFISLRSDIIRLRWSVLIKGYTLC